MTSDNGRIIGPDNTPTTTVASGVWGLDELYEARLGNIWPEISIPYAMELVAPSSIAFSGTSASIVGNGSVDFSAVTSLSLNGVFSADYDNYMIAMRSTVNAADEPLLRWRKAGTDNSTSSSYVNQRLSVSSTSVQGFRFSTTYFNLGDQSATQRCGVQIFAYGPYLNQPTAVRTISALDSSSASMQDWAGTHNQSIVYDGFTIYLATRNMTGNIAVYGLRG